MDTPPPDERRADRVAAVVALKALPAAKSRMSPLPPPLRERLARCMALDTLTALTPAVDEVLVISDQPDLDQALRRHGLPARVLAEPTEAVDGPDTDTLNRALTYGDGVLRSEAVAHVLACVGDLPALRTATVAGVLAASTGHPRSFLADHDGFGTTLLIAHGTPLNPLYGPQSTTDLPIGSAERHRRSGAQPLSLDAVDARWDVDTVEDLATAHRLGLGPATTAMLDPTTGDIGRYVRPIIREHRADMITVETDGRLEDIPRSAYDGDPALLVRGRRVHAVRVGRTLRCWV